MGRQVCSPLVYPNTPQFALTATRSPEYTHTASPWWWHAPFLHPGANIQQGQETSAFPRRSPETKPHPQQGSR